MKGMNERGATNWPDFGLGVHKVFVWQGRKFQS
jgi:hypothetical protein